MRGEPSVLVGKLGEALKATGGALGQGQVVALALEDILEDLSTGGGSRGAALGWAVAPAQPSHQREWQVVAVLGAAVKPCDDTREDVGAL